MIYQKLEGVELPDHLSESCKRVILYDPSDCYKRIKIDPYKRMQQVGMDQMFINPSPTICACGCGQTLEGRKRRWANDDCRTFAFGVYSIINGRSDMIRWYMQQFLPFECCMCHEKEYTIKYEKTGQLCNGVIYDDSHYQTSIHVDHIVAVINGGGGCWLGNLQFICNNCHKIKTVMDKAERNRLKPLPFGRDLI